MSGPCGFIRGVIVVVPLDYAPVLNAHELDEIVL